MSSQVSSELNAQASARAFRPDIQALRAIAVLAVLLYHAGVPFLPGGYVGVDVFFVISGFLITGQLVGSIARNGKLRFADFYTRRIWRIVPTALVVIVLTGIAALIWVPPLQLTSVFQDAAASALYVPNFLFAFQGTDYLANTTPSLFQHYWSLGVEEQFYLIWPALIALIWAFTRRTRSRLTWLVIIVALSLVLCVAVTFWKQPFAFFLLPTRAWELGIGGVLAVAVTRWKMAVPAAARTVLGSLGLVAIVVAIVFFTGNTPFPGYAALLPVVGTVLVIFSGSFGAIPVLSPLFRPRWVQFIGLISYPLYLVHWPLLEVPQAAVGYNNPLPLWLGLALAVVGVGVAYLLHRFVEQPLRGFRKRRGVQGFRSLLLGVGVPVIVAALAIGCLFLALLRPLSTAEAAPVSAPQAPPVQTAFVPANLTPALRSAEADNPILYSDGCHVGYATAVAQSCSFGSPAAPVIALFGDSHAAEWFPALLQWAESAGYQVDAFTKNSCPSAEIATDRVGAAYVACDEWRASVIVALKAHPPALVVMSNSAKQILSGGNANFDTRWSAALGATVSQLTPVTKVAVIADTPDFGASPVTCLSAHLTSAMDCARARALAISSTLSSAEAQAVGAAGGVTIDLTDYLCSATECPAIIGNVLAYRDAEHLTATFSRSLSGALGQRLLAVLGTR